MWVAPLACRWRAAGVPLACRWRAAGVPLACRWRAAGVPLACRWRAAGVPLACRSKVFRRNDLQLFWNSDLTSLFFVVCFGRFGTTQRTQSEEMAHVMTTRFSLIGRPIVLHTPYEGYSKGVVVEQLGRANYSVHLEGYKFNGRPISVDCHRSEFALPPLPREQRTPYWCGDDSDYVYSDFDGFVNPYARA